MEIVRPSRHLSLPGAAMQRVLILLSLATLSYQTQRPRVTLDDVIPPDYDNVQTPDNKGDPTDVSIQIVILNIRSIDVQEMSFIADVFLHEWWKDPRLRYPAFGPHEKIVLHPDWRHKIWTPDLYFYNAVEAKVLSSLRPYVSLWLHNDTTVFLRARLSLEFSCDMLLHAFPHDTQTCDIIIKSLTHGVSDMHLQWSEEEAISLGDCIILPQFELAPPDRSSCNASQEIVKHGETFACLRGIIHLTRRSGYYIINIYIPTILIVFMSMLTFWIPMDAVPGRVTLGVTSLLTIITKQYQASLPSVSYVVALNVWLSVCIGFVFGSLLEYSGVIALRSHQLRIASLESKKLPPDVSWTSSLYHRIEMMDVLSIDRASRVIFPIIFMVHCAVYCVIYM